MPLPPLLTVTFDATAYAQMLDVRDCLIAHGYDVPIPPSQESWMEQGQNGEEQWSAYVAAFWGDWKNSHMAPTISESELAELNKKCPQTAEGGLFPVTAHPAP
ncbi:MAG: hypothetical protein LBB54_06130 [Cellulomonadaceae bacterium]|nr:hypothetical protein [Cellulomonadaceae bacterium]